MDCGFIFARLRNALSYFSGVPFGLALGSSVACLDFLSLKGPAALSDLDSSLRPLAGCDISCRTDERGVAVGWLLPVVDPVRVGFGEATGVRLGEGNGVRLAAEAVAVGETPALGETLAVGETLALGEAVVWVGAFRAAVAEPKKATAAANRRDFFIVS